MYKEPGKSEIALGTQMRSLAYTRANCLVPELHGSGPASERRKLANTSRIGNPGCDLRSSLSARDSLTLELAKERGVFLASQRASSGRSSLKEVDLAITTKSRTALLVGGSIRGAEELACVICDNVLDVVEDVALEDTTSTGITAFEQVALHVEPDIVDGVEQGLATKSRATASGLGDVVVLHGDRVTSANHLKDPVVIAIAASGVIRKTIDEVAGKGDASRGCESEHVVLSARASSLARYQSLCAHEDN